MWEAAPLAERQQHSMLMKRRKSDNLRTEREHLQAYSRPWFTLAFPLALMAIATSYALDTDELQLEYGLAAYGLDC